MDHLADNSLTYTDLAGRKIGDYRLLRRLGSGGMADVYLAVQESLKRNVALKILKKDLAENEDYVDRFKREAQAAAALVHANIVQIFEVGQADGFHFIAQEYVRGRNLKQYLRRYGAVPLDMALSVLRQSTMALQKGAEHEVVHRDIKPENIMLTANGEIKITDFGLARIGNETDSSLTHAGITVGTPLYMSPEQIEGSEVDIRSDIYSLGVTLYHMLAGKPPFDGESPIAIAMKHTSHQPDPIGEHRGDLPDEFTGLIQQMLHKKKEDRPQTPMQLLKTVQSINVEPSNGFDWELFEVKPKGTELEELPIKSEELFEVKPKGTELVSPQLLVDDSPTESFVARRQTWRSMLASGFVVWPALALFSIAAWWAGSEVANQSAGLKNLHVDPAEVEKDQLENDVAMECDVEEQYLAAYWNSRLIAEDDYDKQIRLWAAVKSYFSLEDAESRNKTQLYHLRAQCRLGEIYIKSGNLDKATEVYEELAEQDEMSLEFRTTGLAGRAVVLSLRPEAFFEDGGGIQEQQSLIRLCLDEEIGGVRENVDLLSDFLKKQVLPLLEEFKSYGRYSVPPRATNFAKRRSLNRKYPTRSL